MTPAGRNAKFARLTCDPSRTAAADLTASVTACPAAQALQQRIAAGGALSLDEVTAPAWPFLTALLHRWFPRRPLLVVTRDLKTQEVFHQDLQTWLTTNPGGTDAPRPAIRPLFFPAWEVLPDDGQLPHADVVSERLETLVALGHAAFTNPAPRDTPAPIVVASVMALMQRTFPPDLLRQRLRRLRRGDRVDPLDLVEWLEDQAYEPEAQVTQKGELALRGGILDVYPLTSPWPIRLEFWGDTLESLRYFDPHTQMSREKTADITLAPGGEFGLLRQALAANAAAPKAAPLATLLDHLGPDALVLCGEPDDLDHQAHQYQQQVPAGHALFAPWPELQAALSARALTRIDLTEGPPVEITDPIPLTPLAEEAVRASVDDDVPPVLVPPPSPECVEPDLLIRPLRNELPFGSLDLYRPLAAQAPDLAVADLQRRQFFEQLHRWLRRGFRLAVFCNNTGERDRFAEIWQEYGFESPAPPDASAAEPRRRFASPAESAAAVAALPTGLSTHLGALARGFVCEPARLVVVTDAEIFGRYKVQRPRRLKSPHAAAVRSAFDIDFTDVSEGDFVVHLQHGIGRYLGLQRLPATRGRAAAATPASAEAGDGEECLVIEYAPSAPGEAPPKLYVPVTEAHLVSKYVGAGQARPTLNTLSGTRWAKTKAQASEAVRDFAAELLRLQAARAAEPGFAFPPDAPWQREFESAFIYEETPDQLRAIEAAKRDLEQPRPMDRLICGDVGFGKTEVAIRAAFKAVLAGKQVAILVPTTVLAQQHYNTFRDRMADYPVRVELLSRFRSRAQQQRVLQELAAGTVDIVIGTHRLVQADVAFKELGLVVIDEEQRFGVGHKERLKLLRHSVDVLTLSATPIPRTLYLALTGARDMSTIETPPQDRLPVETVIAPYDERLIRDAIRRELNRGGQAFFLHNRVHDIENVALRLKQLVPEARLAIGHGQMHADELEEIMGRFVNGEVDVLLSTTIIESGIDIPNANTIIIDRADRFGLSDLYQLRGRVGRYKHQAYAYLLIPRHAGLLADARKRISAIRQFSSLGSGFKIAMRDLEIRGAGNLLGPEQSGHITAVGFELYCRLLQHSIATLKGEARPPRPEVAVRLDFLDLSPAGTDPAEAAAATPSPAPAPRAPRLNISVPRDGVRFVPADEADRGNASSRDEGDDADRPRSPACFPLRYVPEPHHRIEMYRKLAQATTKAELEAVRTEARDRFGPLPAAAERLLHVAALKILASERNVTALETRGDKLMLTRHNAFIQVGGKFPRLTRRDPKARLNEIRKVLLSI